MSEDEEQWIEDCHENPMYAASHIMQLQAENSALRELLYNEGWGDKTISAALQGPVE